METEVHEQISQWRQETAEQALLSAQQVQDKLLDLYSALREYPVRIEVEKWLSLTRERSLFEGKEISELLDDIELELQLGALMTEPASS